MRILIDIGHPAHVHYFKNFIKIMQGKGHKFLIIARDKEITFELLEYYGLKFFNRGKGGKSLLQKLFYFPKAILFIYKHAKRYKTDLLLSFASPYAAHVAILIRKPHIAFDDTEHAKLGHLIYVPFTDVICTPTCFQKDFGKKHIRFNGYMELSYLHTNYFIPNSSIIDLLDIEKDEKYVIMRFVSWNASHDIGHSGLSLEMKRKLAKKLSKYTKVFISSESELPENLKQYQIKIPPERMHDALASAALFVGEGATMASECAMLGTPAIYVNSLTTGTLEDQEKHGLLFGFRNSKSVLEKTLELLNTPNLKQEFQNRRQRMLRDKIDLISFMVWFIENYPDSVKIMKENPDYQYRF